MEEIIWFFNADFEEKLFSGETQKFISTKQTQEFEYFINYLNPTSCIYTTKNYSKVFQDRFFKITGENFKTTNQVSQIRPWCQSYEKTELLKKYQNKIKTLLYFKQLGILKHEINEITEIQEITPDFLYKNPFSLSGMGHYEYPRDKNIISKLIQRHPLIKEEKLARIKDISTLVENNLIVSVYENDVDKHYQYRGTLISNDSLLEQSQYQQYLAQIKNVMNYVEDYNGVYSIDSFYYKKDDETYLQPVTEFNMRKTMGYTAYYLSRKYFPNKKFVKLLLLKNKKVVSDELSKKSLYLSPEENIFHVFLLGENSREEIEVEQSRLRSALL